MGLEAAAQAGRIATVSLLFLLPPSASPLSQAKGSSQRAPPPSPTLYRATAVRLQASAYRPALEGRLQLGNCFDCRGAWASAVASRLGLTLVHEFKPRFRRPVAVPCRGCARAFDAA